MFSKNIIELIRDSRPGEREYRITRLRNLKERCRTCEVPFPLKIENMSLKELERNYVYVRRQIEECEERYNEAYQTWSVIKHMSHVIHDRVVTFTDYQTAEITNCEEICDIGVNMMCLYVTSKVSNLNRYFNFEYEMVIISRMVEKLNELFGKTSVHPLEFENIYLNILKEITGGKCKFSYEEEKVLRRNKMLREDFMKLRKLMTMTHIKTPSGNLNLINNDD